MGFLAGFGPLLGTFLLHPDLWSERGLNELNVPAAVPATVEALVKDWNILAPLAWENFLSLSVLPAEDRFYFAPFLLAPEALLLILGTAALIWSWRRPGAFLLLLAAGGVLFTGGTLIEASRIPAFVHWTPVFPIFYVAIALPLVAWARGWRRLDRRLGVLAAVLLAGGLVWDSAANAQAYLGQYPAAVPSWQSLDAAQGRLVAQQAPGTRLRFVAAPWPEFRPNIAAMMGPQVDSADLLNPSRELPLPGARGHDLAFAFYLDQEGYRPLVQALYPGGRLGAMRTPDGEHIATTYTVPAAQADARYGVAVTLQPDAPGAATRQAQVPRIGALPDGGPTYPLTATWSGAVYMPAGGPVTPSVAGAPGAVLTLQGGPAPPGRPVTLEPGWLPFTLQAHLTAPADVRLLLARGGAAPAEPGPGALWPLPAGQGLAVSFADAPGVHRLDPFIGGALRAGPAPTDPAFLPLGLTMGGSGAIRWAGQVQIAAGTTTFWLRTPGPALLQIDGKPVLQVCPPGPSDPNGARAAVPLPGGWHDVTLDFAGGAADRLEWAWTPPGGARSLVPPAALRPPLDAAGAIAWPDPPGTLRCP